jgi:large subunit ribosomal protein L4e
VAYSALIVTGSVDAKVRHISGSLPGVHVKGVRQLSVLDLVPGSKQIRLTIFSVNAIDELRRLDSMQDKMN